MGFARYLRNCFWLIVPVLLFDVACADRLPPAFQMETFWRAIPAAVGVPENILRFAILLLPLLMPLAVATRRQRLGLAVYLFGLAIYFTAWGLQIASPGSPWSTSAAGFLAPAYTPLLWLTGIGLIGDRLFIRQIPYRVWTYPLLAFLFLIFHNMHAAIVFARLH